MRPPRPLRIAHSSPSISQSPQVHQMELPGYIQQLPRYTPKVLGQGLPKVRLGGEVNEGAALQTNGTVLGVPVDSVTAPGEYAPQSQPNTPNGSNANGCPVCVLLPLGAGGRLKPAPSGSAMGGCLRRTARRTARAARRGRRAAYRRTTHAFQAGTRWPEGFAHNNGPLYYKALIVISTPTQRLAIHL